MQLEQTHSESNLPICPNIFSGLAVGATYLTSRWEIKSSLQLLYLKWTRDWGNACLNPSELRAKRRDPLNYVLLNIGLPGTQDAVELSRVKLIKV